MEKQELDALLAELSAQLRELGIPLGKHIAPQVEVNTRAQRRLGCCVCREGRFTIQVSARLLEDAPLLRATLLHELLHTCYGCQNHGKRWKAYAQRVGEALGVEITRTVPLEGPAPPLRQEPVKYRLQSQSCGRLIPRRRLSKAVKYPSRYRCPCGGKLKLLNNTNMLCQMYVKYIDFMA